MKNKSEHWEIVLVIIGVVIIVILLLRSRSSSSSAPLSINQYTLPPDDWTNPDNWEAPNVTMPNFGCNSCSLDITQVSSEDEIWGV